jgi:hypothetical protein
MPITLPARSLAMSEAKLVSYEQNKKGASYLFKSTSSAYIATVVSIFFEAEGYELESGTLEDGTYIRGGGTRRPLSGVLAKRFKFRVRVSPESRKVRLNLTKAMSGAGGGVLGSSEMNRELERIANKIQSLFL